MACTDFNCSVNIDRIEKLITLSNSCDHVRHTSSFIDQNSSGGNLIIYLLWIAKITFHRSPAEEKFTFAALKKRRTKL